jgi:hypothetical protein
MVGQLIERAANFSKQSAAELSGVITAIVAAMIALCVVATAIIIPYLVALQRARDAPIKVFLQLPALVARQLQLLVERRLKNLKADTDEEGSDDDMSDDEDGGDAGGLMRAGGGGGGAGGTGGGGNRRGSLNNDDMSVPSQFQDGYADCDWDAVYARITVEEQRRLRKLAHKAAREARAKAAKAGAKAGAKGAAAAAAPASGSGSPVTPKDGGGLGTPLVAAAVGGATLTSGGASSSPAGPTQMKFITQVEDRKFKAGRASLCKLLLFLLPILVIVAFYVGLWVMADDTLRQVTNLSIIASLAAARVAAIRSLGSNGAW